MYKVAQYIAGRKLRGDKRYPLVLMLEPLFQCNLACAGCGKIDYPKEILQKRVSVEDALRAVDECGAPMVSIPGGEPLIHKEMPQIVAGIVARKKFVYLCTNAILLAKHIDEYQPSKYLTFSVHLDGNQERHDESVCLEGVYEKAVAAIRLARGFTGRNFVVKFEGCYHGHSDAMLVKAGSGVATLGIPGSAGVPPETAMHTLALPYNDLDAVREVFTKWPDEIACVIVEPVVGNAGTIPPTPGYLQGLREITAEFGALLILDEVMTGFRLSLGGAQQVYGVTPDLTTLGKIIGGGLPCGAFGGRADVMEFLAPLGPVYQAGTLSGNPLAMAAGIATLGHLIAHEEDVYLALEATTTRIAEGVGRVAHEAGIPLTTNRVGSMFTWFFTGQPVTDFTSAATSDTVAFGRFHRAMLDAGVWLPPSQYEAAFVSTAHGEAEIGMVLEAARSALAEK